MTIVDLLFHASIEPDVYELHTGPIGQVMGKPWPALPDWVSVLRLIKEYLPACKPWEMVPNGPEPAWWLNAAGLLAQADSRVAKVRQQQADARSRGRH